MNIYSICLFKFFNVVFALVFYCLLNDVNV